MKLYGRKPILDGLLRSTAPLTIVAGDSGTGKSAVLATLQEFSSGMSVSPASVKIARSPGSLQRALLESLGSAVALMAEDMSTTERLARKLAEAAEKASEATLKDLRRAVGRYLLSAVRTRVGAEAANLIRDVGASLWNLKDETLTARITSASDHDVVEEILTFITEVGALAGERTVYLALDDLDRLANDDLRRLADILERLPEGVRVRASYAAFDADSRHRLDSLKVAGASSVGLHSLSEDSLVEWLVAEDLSSVLAPPILAATNGYPLHVEDAIDLLREDPRETTLAKLRPDEVVATRVKMSWRGLDEFTQVAAAKLAAFVDRPSEDRITELLGIDVVTWGTFEIRLRESGLFVDEPVAWFHELRRKALWTNVLSGSMRLEAIEAATSQVRLRLTQAAPEPQDLVDFARLANDNTTLHAEEPSVKAVIMLSRDAISVAAAMLELVEVERGDKAVAGESLLSHAAEIYSFDDDPIQALEELANAGFAHVASNEHSSAVVPTWGSIEAVHAVMGRAAIEFGRLPTPQIATSLFETVVRPRLGPFDMASYGVGRPSMERGIADIFTMHTRPKNGIRQLDESAPGLVFRASHGGIPLFGHIAYDSSDARDSAVNELEDFAVDVFNDTLSVEALLPLPTDVIPSLRFASAIEWLDGHDGFSAHMHQSLRLDNPIDLAEGAEIRRRLRNVVRQQCSAVEWFAYNLEDTVGFAYAQRDDGSTLIELRGRDATQQLDPSWSGSALHGSYSRLKLAQELDLAKKEFVGTITSWYGQNTTDPITDEIAALVDLATSFNSHQRTLELSVEESNLGTVIERAQLQRAADGRAILSSLPDARLTEPEPRAMYILLIVPEVENPWDQILQSVLYTASVQGDSRDGRIEFELRQGHEIGGSESPLIDIYRLDRSSIRSTSTSAAGSGLAHLLSHDPGDIRLKPS